MRRSPGDSKKPPDPQPLRGLFSCDHGQEEAHQPSFSSFRSSVSHRLMACVVVIGRLSRRKIGRARYGPPRSSG